jgi:aminoglycoside 6'-N-acetyltransferase
MEHSSPTKAFIIHLGIPLGFIQAYRLRDWPEYAAEIGEPEGISLDLFIGELRFVGRGWGRVILLEFLLRVAFPTFPDEQHCWIAHDLRNDRARRASRGAGYKPVRTVVEAGSAKELLVLSRAGARSGCPS